MTPIERVTVHPVINNLTFILLSKVTDTELNGVPVRIYRPEGLTAGSPGVVFYHGGGWVWGSIGESNLRLYVFIAA